MKHVIFRILKNFIRVNKLCEKFLERYLWVKDIAYNEIAFGAEQTYSDKVWTMWLQEDVPDICKICINSIKKFYPNVIVITEKNINDFVEIPFYILEKYKKGVMKPCHFSDYVRICLLDKYGGMWIDATCFMTDFVPNFIREANFFILQDFEKKTLSNYFIISKQNNYMTKVMKVFLEKYWEKENKAIYYFFFHAFLRLVKEHDKQLKHIWENIPINLNYNTKLMYKVIYKDFNPDIFKWLCKTSYMHKLTYKNVLENDTNENSLYRYLIKNNL